MTLSITSQTAYLFNREQLLRALTQHIKGREDADRIQTTVLAFLDGDAAKANGLQWNQPPIEIEEVGDGEG